MTDTAENVEQLPATNETPAALVERGLDLPQWRVLNESIFPGASKNAILMAFDYCKARSLDIFKRPVHIVKVWSSAAGKEIETVWPAIAELRTTAFRTGVYGGCDEADFGPTTELHFDGRRKVKGNWENHTCDLKFPEWCRFTMYRFVQGHRVKFVGPKVLWLETYASVGVSDGPELPNYMWARRASGQLEKCAEAAALRKTFPEELGGEYTAEEMEGQRIGPDQGRDATPLASEPTDEPRPERVDFAETREPGWPLHDASGEVIGDYLPEEWMELFFGNLNDNSAPDYVANNIEAGSLVASEGGNLRGFLVRLAEAGWPPEKYAPADQPEGEAEKDARNVE